MKSWITGYNSETKLQFSVEGSIPEGSVSGQDYAFFFSLMPFTWFCIVNLGFSVTSSSVWRGPFGTNNLSCAACRCASAHSAVKKDFWGLFFFDTLKQPSLIYSPTCQIWYYSTFFYNTELNPQHKPCTLCHMHTMISEKKKRAGTFQTKGAVHASLF